MRPEREKVCVHRDMVNVSNMVAVQVIQNLVITGTVGREVIWGAKDAGKK